MIAKHILVVDDDDFARQCLRDALAGGAYGLSEAADGDEALSQVTQTRPDLVLLDLLMPNRSGLEVLAQIAATQGAPPVVVISSLDTRTLIDRAMRAGASGFVSKPFHASEIVDAVERALQA